MRLRGKHFMRLVDDERGASAVLIALLLIPLMGVGALALDISAQHAERTQLQLGADAAALAVAASCAEEEATCAAAADAIATGSIEANGGTPVPGTAESVEFDWTEQTVRVTAMAAFPHFLASLIDTDDDPDSTTVRASATARWGVPDAGTTIPLTVGECELTRHLINPATGAGAPFILELAGPGASGPPDCGPGYPGGFGWLEGDDVDGDGSADCEVVIEVGVPESGIPGSSDTHAGGCPSDYITDLLGEIVRIPLYDSYTAGSSGSHGSYNISRFAAFRITGYKVASAPCEAPGVSRAGACYLPGEQRRPGFGPGQFGLQGQFVRYIAIGDEFEPGTGPDGGLRTARLIG